MLSQYAKVAMIILSGVLTACSVTLPEKNIYTLDKINADTLHAPHTSKVVYLTRMQSVPAFDTSKMAYQQYPYQVAYFAKNEWADSPNKLILPVMMDSLLQTDHFAGVVTSPYRGNVDYRIDSKLMRLQQNFLTKPSVEELAIQVTITNNHTQRLIAVREFSIVEPTVHENPYGGVVAANCALEKFLAEFSAFVLARI